MQTAILVGVMIFSAGLLWLWENQRQRRRMQRKTREAFEARSRARDRPGKWPLARLHPRYARWLAQAGSKRSPEKLEQQQWLFGLGTAAIIQVLTRSWFIALLLGIIAFLYPVLQVRAKAKAVAKSIAAEMRLFILLLKIYVKAGLSNLQALRLVEPHLKGHLRRIVHDAQSLMSQMTFEEAMQIVAQQSPSEELEVVAKALKQGTKYGAEISETLNQAIAEINHQDMLRLGSKQRNTKTAVYMKFMLFFVSPFILDVMLFVWGMVKNAAGQF
jgi:Flp pilus assembly protein TadB